MSRHTLVLALFACCVFGVATANAALDHETRPAAVWQEPQREAVARQQQVARCLEQLRQLQADLDDWQRSLDQRRDWLGWK